MHKAAALYARIAMCLLLCLGPGMPLPQAHSEDITDSASLARATDEALAHEDPLRGENMKISLSLRNIDVIEALKFLAMKSGLNIVPTQRVTGRVTLRIENIPVKDVLDIMLRSNNLAYDKKGEIYSIMTEAEYKMLFGKNFFDTRQVKMFRLKYAIPESVFNLLDAVKSDIGRLLVESESGAVMFIDTPEKIAEAEKAIAALEQQNTVKVFNLKYANAKNVEEQLKTQLDLKKVGMIKADERTNQVVVQTLPERMHNIEELITSLDKKTKAVLIDTKILKIKLDNQQDEGIEWEGLFSIAKQYGMSYVGSYPFSAVQAASAAWRSRSQVLSDMGGSVGSYPFSGFTNTYNAGTKKPLGQQMHVGIVDKDRDFDVLINFLQTLGKTKILASPSISVINNQEAKIHIGERRAYVTTTTTTGTTTTTVSEEVTYVDVGVRLSVTPTINDEGYITMKVKPEISSVIDTVVSSSDNEIPIIDTNTAETTVIAKNGTTILIGGLGREEMTEDTQQVPFLGKIPFLGFFFRNTTKTSQRVELVIMLTPIIFEGDKLVLPEDADKFIVKPPRRYDVFRPEVSAQEFAPVMEQLPLDYDFGSKGFKMYDGTFLKHSPQMLSPSAVFVPSNEEIAVKGFKSYN